MLDCTHCIYLWLVGGRNQIIGLIRLPLAVVYCLPHEKWFKLVEAFYMMFKVALSTDATAVVHVEILSTRANSRVSRGATE